MASGKKTSTVAAKKPVSIWSKPVKLRPAKFVEALTKGIYDAATGDWKSLGGDVGQALDATGLSTDAGELAWKLVLRALVRSVFDLIDETKPFPHDSATPERARFIAGLESALGSAELALDRSFFDRPGDLALLSTLAPPLSAWLVAHGAAEADARSILRRLPAYFTYALHQEWHERAAEYAPLLQTLDTPFAKAGERERAWERYAARLQRQIQEPMLGEAFGIAHVYVPLRGYYEEPKEPNAPLAERRMGAHEARGETVRHVIEVSEALDAWVGAAGKDEPALRVIAGGPGSGKSSLAKMFAARRAARGDRVLYVPLHLIDPEKDLKTAVGDFVQQQDILPANPLDQAGGERRLLLVLDGLDELAMQGKGAAEMTQKFVEEVRRLVDNRNHDEVRLQVLLGGREIVVQLCRAELRKPRQVIYLLPYYLSDGEVKGYVDPTGTLKADQRDAWWQSYGAAKGKTYDAMPVDLRRPDLDEITAQPLLGYLVALSHDRAKIDFSRKSELNRNVVYYDLIHAVHDRTYAGRRHQSVGGLSVDDFVHLLEEVGLSTWHGDGRTTTVAAIQALCARSGLDRLLDRFEEGAASGAARLLTAFYFRQRDRRSDGERTFEFTHKSFGEYLAARRIVHALMTMEEELRTRERRPGRGWSERDALRHWAETCGPSVMDEYILTFVRGELRGTETTLVGDLQKMLARLIGYMLANGMPMEELNPRPAYAEEAHRARNAEEALLACLSTCAARTEAMSEVVWPTEASFGAWIRRLQGRVTGSRNVVALRSLARLSLREQRLGFIDGHDAVLEFANLDTVWAYGGCFERANLEQASLRHADLEGANLEGANLEGANLEGANLERANLYRANLYRANLYRASLYRANLQGANLRAANLQGANLLGANLQSANLQGANLQGADFLGANLQGADFLGVDLTACLGVPTLLK